MTVSNFTTCEPWVATEDDVKASWAGRRDGSRFSCGLCGHRFAVGETVRFQWMKSHPNFLVCAPCDGPDVQERFATFREQTRWIRDQVRSDYE